MSDVQRRVVCAANYWKDDNILILGARHWDAIMHTTYQNLQNGGYEFNSRACEQGFIDQFGVFMTREEAKIVAEAAGQIIRRVGGDGKKLYSENLY